MTSTDRADERRSGDRGVPDRRRARGAGGTKSVGLVLLAALVAAIIAASAPAVSGTDTITTVVGTGVAGFSGDGGPAEEAQLFRPAGLAATAAGNLYIGDSSNHRVRVAAFPRGGPVAGGRSIRTLLGTGTPGSSLAELKGPHGVAIDVAGSVYVADSGNHRVVRVTAAGAVQQWAGTGTSGFSGDGGQASTARLDFPTAVATDAAGNLYIADTGNSRIRRVGPAGVITTVAGTGEQGYGGDGGPATAAKLFGPQAVAVDAAGRVLIADTLNNRVRRIDGAGVITTVAGTGGAGGAGDGGLATAAMLAGPAGLAVDAAGTVYIADFGNHRVRKIDRAGVITTVAGTGAGFSGDGGPAAAARLALPYGLAVDGNGNLYVADRVNDRIRMVRNVLPTASFTATPQSGSAPLTVTLDASASADPNGEIVSYTWDFGDGQTGSGRTATHTYAAQGTYTARLTVMDDSGARRAAQGTIAVGAPAAPAPPVPPPPAPVPPPQVAPVLCEGRVATIVGTAGNDRIVGTPRRDVIAGLGGNDVIDGRGGNDLICGGPGNDLLLGGNGNDRLLGGPGNDRLLGGRGNDQLYGGPGNDRLAGGPGRDRADGGPGRDVCLAELRRRCP